MLGRQRRQRIRQGALSAKRSPARPPAPVRLVPREDFVRRLEQEGGQLILPPPPTDPGKPSR